MEMKIPHLYNVQSRECLSELMNISKTKFQHELLLWAFSVLIIPEARAGVRVADWLCPAPSCDELVGRARAV